MWLRNLKESDPKPSLAKNLIELNSYTLNRTAASYLQTLARRCCTRMAGPQARHLQHQDCSASPYEAGAAGQAAAAAAAPTAALSACGAADAAAAGRRCLGRRGAAGPFWAGTVAAAAHAAGCAAGLYRRPRRQLWGHEAPPFVAAAVAAAALPVAAAALVEGAQTAAAMAQRVE